ncbi:zinc finger (CCCH type) motif-containing protein [Besnoitia besnoiti]|uniref:Zinc finger (CCCH type) motif-containing protein n=1 Tax=Besnoitia besnoiti TaxID=94643 RepID=A0A2A9MM95_BESBE|nr:zinc finger (CCCH type) motif-containing protein [Besnoitia besnoiti]PFH37521.1 zinc finger (CCCH type) motif-containing protein [Besnoitia besnoiti]
MKSSLARQKVENAREPRRVYCQIAVALIWMRPGYNVHKHQESFSFSRQLYKTALCVRWQMGRCNAGSLCRHAHGKNEMRNSIGTVPPDALGADGSLPVLVPGSPSSSYVMQGRARLETTVSGARGSPVAGQTFLSPPQRSSAKWAGPNAEREQHIAESAAMARRGENPPTPVLLPKSRAAGNHTSPGLFEAQRGDVLPEGVGFQERVQSRLQSVGALHLASSPPSTQASAAVAGNQEMVLQQLQEFRKLLNLGDRVGALAGEEGLYCARHNGKKPQQEEPCGAKFALAFEQRPSSPVDTKLAGCSRVSEVAGATTNCPTLVSERALAAHGNRLWELLSPSSQDDLDSVRLATTLDPGAAVERDQATRANNGSASEPERGGVLSAEIYALSSPQTRLSLCPHFLAGSDDRRSMSFCTRGTPEELMLPPSPMAPLHASGVRGPGRPVGDEENAEEIYLGKTTDCTLAPADTGKFQYGDDSAVVRFQPRMSRRHSGAEETSFANGASYVRAASERHGCNSCPTSVHPAKQNSGVLWRPRRHELDADFSGRSEVLWMQEGCRRASSGASTIDTTPRSIDALNGFLCSLSLSGPYSPMMSAGVSYRSPTVRRGTFDGSADSAGSVTGPKLRTQSSSDDGQREGREGAFAAEKFVESSSGSVTPGGNRCSEWSGRAMTAPGGGTGVTSPTASIFREARGSEARQDDGGSDMEGETPGDLDCGLEEEFHGKYADGVPQFVCVSDWEREDDHTVFPGEGTQVVSRESRTGTSAAQECCDTQDIMDTKKVLRDRASLVQKLYEDIDPSSDRFSARVGETSSKQEAGSLLIPHASEEDCNSDCEQSEATENIVLSRASVPGHFDERNLLTEIMLRGSAGLFEGNCSRAPRLQEMNSQEAGRRSSSAGGDDEELKFQQRGRFHDGRQEGSELFRDMEAFRRTCCGNRARVSTCCSHRDPADSLVAGAMKRRDEENLGECWSSQTDNSHCSILFNGPALFWASCDSL